MNLLYLFPAGSDSVRDVVDDDECDGGHGKVLG